MKTEKTKTRRDFLVAASLGTAGAVAAVATTQKGRSGESVPAPDAKQKGYHVSDHILKYYKTTQV